MNNHYGYPDSQLINARLASPASWQLLKNIDAAFSAPTPLLDQLQRIAEILLDALPVDALWLSTSNPLPLLGCGLVDTPLVMAPNARVDLADQIVRPTTAWPPPETLLKQVIDSQSARFIKHDEAAISVDGDLCDTLFGAFDVTPLAAVPLNAGQQQCWGALVVGAHNPIDRIVPEPVRDQLQYLATYLARHLQNRHLVKSAQRHDDILYTLQHIAQTITSSLDIDEIVHRTMAGINALLNVEAGSLLLLDETTRELYFKITLRGENKQVASYRLGLNEGIAGWVVTHNQPALVNNPAQDPRFSSKIDRAISFVTRSILCTPLTVQGRAIGVLEVLNKFGGSFSQNDQDLLEAVSGSLGIALNNATLFHNAQERAEQNELINQITAAINTGRGLSETAKLIFSQFKRLFTFDHISFTLIDEDTATIRQWTFTEYGCHEQKPQPFSVTEDSRLARLIEQRHGLVEDDISVLLPDHAPYPDDQILLTDDIKARVTIPLVTRSTPYGSLSIGSRQVGKYGLRDLAFLEQLGLHLAIVIEKALLINQMERRNSELHLLNRLSEMLASTTQTEAMIGTILNMLPRIVPNDVHGVIIAGHDGAFAGLAVPFGLEDTAPIEEKLLELYAELSQTQQPDPVISKIVPGNMPVPSNWQPTVTRSLPILTKEGTQGLIYTASGAKGKFSDEMLRIFSLLASQIAKTLENVRLLQQVEQERARLAAILTSSTDAVLMVDGNGRIVQDNPATWDILAVLETQRGRLLSEATTLKSLVDLFERAMAEGSTTGEILLEDERTFFANISPVSVDGRAIIGWVATMQDVSYFKELNQLKNEFVNTVSHDLRSPLAGMTMATKLIEEMGPLNEQQQSLIEVVEQRITDMRNLIDDLLDVGSIEAGLELEFEPCDLSYIAEKVGEALTTQAAEKSIRLEMTLAEDLPPVRADFGRLGQAIHNLVGNAIKYTPKQGTVSIKTFYWNNDVRLQVIDTGMGIPASDQPHIFEKFYRVRGEHMVKFKGTGLGLAIVKSIIEKHNGRVWLESIFGEGSTFTVTIPALRSGT